MNADGPSSHTPRRILLKLSGEALAGDAASGIEPGKLHDFASEIAALATDGLQIGLVVGGGNLFRGAQLARSGLDRVTADHMGMLATVMNALALSDQLNRVGAHARVMSALAIEGVCDRYSRARALEALDAGTVVLFAAGTGNPFFTTDTGAALRAIEIGADLMIKATQVDGVYSADPRTDPTATRFDRIGYNEAIRRGLGFMDLAAMVLARDHGLRICVMNIHERGALRRLAAGEPVGSLIEA